MADARPSADAALARIEGAADGTHAAVLERLEAQPTKARLLDAPCGAGALSERASALGYDVRGVDVVRHPDLRLDAERFTCADLNLGVPFDDGAFDTVMSVEGIEHLDSPRAYVRELARVLRPGGRLIVSTPNVLSVRSRWRWLTRGYHRHFTPDAEGRFSSDHLHAMDYVLLRRFLGEAGLEICNISCNRRVANLRDRLVGWWIRRASRRHPFAEVIGSDDLLFGQILIVEAEKKGAAG